MIRVLLPLIAVSMTLTAGQATGWAKQRVLVLTDISNEPDDEQSLVRFLVYSNEFDVEGLIATTSVWLRDQVRPERIRRQIEAFGRVRENLLVHASGYPTPEALLAVTRTGLPEFGMTGVGEGKTSEGSRHIIEVVDRPDSRPVWVTVWGGVNCLAQALWDVRHTRSQAEVDQFVSKLRVYTISDQDDSGRWIRENFPQLFYIVSPSNVDHLEYHRATWTGISGDRFYRNAPGHHFDLVDNPWLEENVIRNHGPLGELYPRLEYIMEGDTPSFLGLIDNGLASHVVPSYGGWGGRYVRYQAYGESRPIWTNNAVSRDTVTTPDGTVHTSDQATIWRWREAFQNDFAARMDWCVAEEFSAANHNPVAVVNGVATKDPFVFPRDPGDTLVFDASESHDPDSDQLQFRWFWYPEAGNFQGEVQLLGSSSPVARWTVPAGASGVAHIILEVRDDGDPPLFSYRRILVDVQP